MSSLQKLDLDFSGRRPAPKLLGLVLLVAGMAACAWAAPQFAILYNARISEQTAYDALTSRIHSIGDVNDGSAKDTPADLQAYRNADMIAGQLHTPWDDLLKMLEAAPMKNVALLSVEPVAARRQLRLSAEARNLTTMLDYLAYLQGEAGLHQVILISHQVQAQAPGSPVRFLVQARWGGP